jgi:hypothetical protein
MHLTSRASKTSIKATTSHLIRHALEKKKLLVPQIITAVSFSESKNKTCISHDTHSTVNFFRRTRTRETTSSSRQAAVFVLASPSSPPLLFDRSFPIKDAGCTA